MNDQAVRDAIQIHVNSLEQAIALGYPVATIKCYHDLCVLLSLSKDTERLEAIFAGHCKLRDRTYQVLIHAFLYCQKQFSFMTAIAKPPIPDNWCLPSSDWRIDNAQLLIK